MRVPEGQVSPHPETETNVVEGNAFVRKKLVMRHIRLAERRIVSWPHLFESASDSTNIYRRSEKLVRSRPPKMHKAVTVLHHPSENLSRL